MKARLLAQPFADGINLSEFLKEVAEEKGFTRLRVAVAWAKRSGLLRAGPHLETIGARGGNLELFVGISEGGATWQGLELASQLFDSVHVVHDQSGRTFHPKIYLANGPDRAFVLIGSNNLTAGGIYYNYEAGAIIELDLNDDDDRIFFETVEKLIADLAVDTSVCVELTNDVFDELLADGRYRIQDEDSNRQSSLPDAPEDLDAALDNETAESTNQAVPLLFGKSQSAKKPAVPLPGPQPSRPATSSPSTSTTQRTGSPHPVASSPVVRRWFKKMSNSDAQQTSNTNTAVTGNLKLTKARLPIDHKTFFRSDFFGSCNWAGKQSARGVKEEAVVPFDFVVNNRSIGTYPLKVDHATFRVASQGNVATWLHWGNTLGEYLKKNSHVNDHVTLERKANGQYVITISKKPVGPYIV